MAYETQMRFSSTQNVVTNTSHIIVYFDFRRTDRNYVGHNLTGESYWEIKCDGRSSGKQYFTFNWNIPQNSWKEVGRENLIFHIILMVQKPLQCLDI